MLRPAIALAAALLLHILLLMSILPENPMQTPEFRGSGRVTVAIARRPVHQDREQQPQRMEAERKQQALDPHAVETVPPPAPEPEQRDALQPAVTEKKEPAAKVSVTATEQKPRSRPPARKDPSAQKKTVAQGSAEPSTEASGQADGESLRSPVPLSALNRPPAYPALARKRGWEGTVVLAVAVTAAGKVAKVEVRTGSSYDLLDREAVRAVSAWRFSPATREGKPTAMTVLVPVHFILRDN